MTSRSSEPSANGVHPQPDGSRGLVTTRLDTLRPRPVRWLVHGYIPSGKLTLLAGDGGHGKTTLTLHLAAAATKGNSAFGLSYDPPPPADVLLISCEDDFEDTVVPRLLAMGADLVRAHRVDGVKTKDGKPAPFSLAHYLQLTQHLEDNPNVRLVVIDPAGDYIGRAGIDDHKDSELRTLLGPLAELAAKYDVAIVLVKHLSKGATAKAVHKVGGSVGYVNAVRAAFVVAPHPDDGRTKLFLPLKFNLAEKPGGITFRLEPPPEAEREEIAGRFGDLTDDDRRRLADQLFRPTWGEVADMDADEALGQAAPRDRPSAKRVDACADWLVGFLGEYAWPDQELQDAADEGGFTLDNLKRAKAKLRKALPPLKSKPATRGGAWWNWMGEERPRDRPTPYQRRKPAPETSHSQRTPQAPHTPQS